MGKKLRQEIPTRDNDKKEGQTSLRNSMYIRFVQFSEKVTWFLMPLFVFLVATCARDNPVIVAPEKQSGALVVRMGYPGTDITISSTDTFIVSIFVHYYPENDSFRRFLPNGAMEPLIVKILGDSSYTARVISVSSFTVQAMCRRDDPTTLCVHGVQIQTSFLSGRNRRYYYYTELVNYPTIRSDIHSFFML